jgi:hypothetical protein
LALNLSLTSSQLAGVKTGPGVSSGEEVRDEEALLAGWQRFYALHQSDMEQKLNRFRGRLRQAMSLTNDELAKLAALDKLMQQSMADQTRKRLALLPGQLKKRFTSICSANEQSAQQLQQMHNDMQALLLAELDVRMQPILGLLEACEAHLNEV